jgi:hypothetical protein
LLSKRKQISHKLVISNKRTIVTENNPNYKIREDHGLQRYIDHLIRPSLPAPLPNTFHDDLGRDSRTYTPKSLGYTNQNASARKNPERTFSSRERGKKGRREPQFAKKNSGVEIRTN